ncbi:MAG: DNA recombination protein RmuC [Gammaproteobacteria bacterium]
MIDAIILTPFWSGFLLGGAMFVVVCAPFLWLIEHRHKTKLAAISVKLEQQATERQVLSTDLAVARQKIADLERLEPRLVEKEEAIAVQLQEIGRLRTSNAELATRLEEERIKAGEKLELIKSAERQMVHQFESLGARILDEKSKIFSEQNTLNLNRLLSPLREQLGEFRKKVDDVYVEESKDRASLREAIRALNLENQRIGQEANNLVRALKGDSKVQGVWGELVLERVLERSGLRNGIEYHTQGGFRDADNRLLKPDVIVHLPENKEIIIDSKVSLVAYETYASADSDPVRQQAIKDHIRAVKAHIKSLSEKDYSSLRGLRSLDFVLLFMPIETAFLLAFEHDESLFAEALQRNIIVVTPTTLLATLRTIENIWRYERQNENARMIAGKAASLYDKIRVFVEDFEKLGAQIATVHGTYESARNRLSQGKGNLLRQAGNFVDLGIQVKKKLPRSVLDQASGDDFSKDDDDLLD